MKTIFLLSVRTGQLTLFWIAILCLAGATADLHGETANGSRSALSQQPVDHLHLGKTFGAAGKWKAAEGELRIYRNQHPDSEIAIVLHAEALIKLGEPFDAALELQGFLSEHPKALRVHELYAVLAGGPLKDSTLAASELEICVHLAPNDFLAWESLGDLDLDQAKADKAAEAYGHASRLEPGDAVAAASLAHAYAEQGLQTSEGRVAHSPPTQRSNQSGKSSAIVDYLYGVYLAEQGQGQESVNALSKALKFNPNSADTYYWRARAYEKLGNLKNAENDAREAIKLSPFDKEAPLFLITLYRKAGDMENAQKYAEIARKIADQEQATATFGRSLRDALDKAEPLLKQGNFAEATPLYESIISQLPTFYEAYFDLGMCYGQTRRPHESEEAFRKYLSFQPVSADGHAALGVLLLGEGRGQEATSELSQAIQIDPGAIEARKALAGEYLNESNPRAALLVLKPVENTRDEELLVLLAVALEQSGNYRLAQTEVERVLATDPKNPDAMRVMDSLRKHDVKKPVE